jgi:sugar-specific transcriptional regulator TrmB
MTVKRLNIAKAGSDKLLTELSTEMQKLGFTDYETRIFVQLLKESPATAYEISKATGVPRPNTYNALDALAQRGVVQPVSEDPVRYAAVEPKLMLDRIARSTRQVCDSLTEKLSKITKPEDTQFVWTTRGDQAVHDKVNRMISGAREHVWVKAADAIVLRHREALAAAASRGVDVLIVLFGAESPEFNLPPNVRLVPHEGTGMRMGIADNLFTIAVDHNEALAANTEGSVYAAYTQNQSVVTMALSLIRHEYYLAKIYARLGKEMDKAFGPHLMELRADCFTPAQFAAFRKRLGLE